jgi:hypothetical protein
VSEILNANAFPDFIASTHVFSNSWAQARGNSERFLWPQRMCFDGRLDIQFDLCLDGRYRDLGYQEKVRQRDKAANPPFFEPPMFIS